jgi:hypothetical protein
MTERKVFGVVVRGLGAYLAVLGVQQIWSVLFLAFSKYANEQSRYPILDVSTTGLVWFAVSYVLVRKADWIVDLAYERPSDPSEPDRTTE